MSFLVLWMVKRSSGILNFSSFFGFEQSQILLFTFKLKKILTTIKIFQIIYISYSSVNKKILLNTKKTSMNLRITLQYIEKSVALQYAFP